MSFVLKSADSAELVTRFAGNKAKSLVELSRIAAPVPEWFCVTSAAQERFFRGNMINDFLRTIASVERTDESLRAFAQEAEKRCLGSSMSPEVSQAIEAEIAILGLKKRSLAVRTSVIGSGQSRPSFLFQKSPIEVSIAVRKCWASVYSFESLRDRLRQNEALWPTGVGVVIQRMIHAEVSGSATPTPRGGLEIQALWGAGGGSKSRQNDCDRFILSKGSPDFVTLPSDKARALYDGEDGGTMRSVPASERAKPCLSEAQVNEVITLARDLEARLGAPHFIEWAIEGGKLYCLQAQPLDAMGRAR